VDFTGLTEEQRALAVKVLNSSDCECGCGMTVAQCRVEDQNCPRSPVLARAILDAVRRGENEAGVRAAYQAVVTATRPTATPGLQEPGQQVYSFAVDDSPVRGAAEAPITLVVFSDFECPFCRQAGPIVDRLLEEFEGEVRLVFKHFPLAFHANARLAAAAAEGARQQGKFWEMHDLLFQHTGALERESLLEFAGRLGLDREKLEAALDSPQTFARIERDLAEGRRVGVNGTPTYYINGRQVLNYKEMPLRRYIQRELVAHKTSATP
jgi:protein-disulfide isomerase